MKLVCRRLIPLKPAAWALLAYLVPSLALACPVCAERAEAHPYWSFALLAALLSVPYAAGAVVIKAVRRLDEGASKE